MRPVDQTETEFGKGNCLAACVASILELPIESVPNFRLAEDQWTALQEWLGRFKLYAFEFDAESVFRPVPPVDCIVIGDSPRNPVFHAVVGKLDGQSIQIVHDPHPTRLGLLGNPKNVLIFGVLPS